MSSLYQEPNGRWILQLKVADARTTLRLGQLSKTKANKVKTYIDEILENQRYGTQPRKESEVAQWLSSLPREMASRLERVGLLSCTPATRLGEFLESFIAERESQYKQATIEVCGNCTRNLLAFFGEAAAIAGITRDDALAFREHLLTSPSG